MKKDQKHNKGNSKQGGAPSNFGIRTVEESERITEDKKIDILHLYFYQFPDFTKREREVLIEILNIYFIPVVVTCTEDGKLNIESIKDKLVATKSKIDPSSNKFCEKCEEETYHYKDGNGEYACHVCFIKSSEAYINSLSQQKKSKAKEKLAEEFQLYCNNCNTKGPHYIDGNQHYRCKICGDTRP